MKDLDAIILLILVILGVGSCSYYSTQRVDAIVARVLNEAP
jgi:hypothetical protein